jgi:C4-dicarboxylate transporter DctM subunit
MIPLFMLLGHISYHTDIYHAARVWLKRLPGGVAMASVLVVGDFLRLQGRVSPPQYCHCFCLTL